MVPRAVSEPDQRIPQHQRVGSARGRAHDQTDKKHPRQQPPAHAPPGRRERLAKEPHGQEEPARRARHFIHLPHSGLSLRRRRTRELRHGAVGHPEQAVGEMERPPVRRHGGCCKGHQEGTDVCDAREPEGGS